MGVDEIKSDILDDDDWITFIVLTCWDEYSDEDDANVFLSIGNNIGEDREGGCCFGERDTGMITGDEHEFSSLFFINKEVDGWSTLELIIVVPHKREAVRVFVKLGHGSNEVSVYREPRRVRWWNREFEIEDSGIGWIIDAWEKINNDILFLDEIDLRLWIYPDWQYRKQRVYHIYYHRFLVVDLEIHK